MFKLDLEKAEKPELNCQYLLDHRKNNRMGKTRDLFKKTRDKGNISCKDGLHKGQKWYGLNKGRRY